MGLDTSHGRFPSRQKTRWILKSPEGASESRIDLFQLATEDVVEQIPGKTGGRVAFPGPNLDKKSY